MNKTIELLKGGFESSGSRTPEFMNFVKVFKSEFRKELKTIGATNIKFNVLHFGISGFFTTLEGQPIYFSISDVRGFEYGLKTNPNSFMNQMLYRKAKDYKDYNGEINRYVKIEFGMIDKMVYYFN